MGRIKVSFLCSQKISSRGGEASGGVAWLLVLDLVWRTACWVNCMLKLCWQYETKLNAYERNGR